MRYIVILVMVFCVSACTKTNESACPQDIFIGINEYGDSIYLNEYGDSVYSYPAIGDTDNGV